MALYCPACKNEILPYLKTGEFKQIQLVPAKNVVFQDAMEYLTSYQFYFCIHCKVVYYEKHESYLIKPLQKEEPIAKDPGKVSNAVKGKVGK